MWLKYKKIIYIIYEFIEIPLYLNYEGIELKEIYIHIFKICI